MSRHIVLVGDSIFDNEVYVPGKPSVIQQLGAELGTNGKATLLATDGDVTDSVEGQLRRLPADATHLVVSVGGNDALQHTELLDKAIQNSSQVFVELAAIHAHFRQAYAEMLAAVLKHGKPTVVCTVYDCNFEPARKRLADVALAVFNDAILRCASDVSVPVIDLRRIFTECWDYANPIEPSEVGGAKMVKAIVNAIDEHDFSKRWTTLYA
ncbi:MAG: SGNH/GDSL hydrolase family protein [Planctomycetota bacterium]